MTARPKINKIVNSIPLFIHYIPYGVSEDKLEELTVTIEELDSMNLKDRQGLDQNDAAKRMGISRGTYQRLLKSARKKLITAIMEGKAVRFEGGNYIQDQDIEPIKCLKGKYHYRINRKDLKDSDQEYRLSNIRCSLCGKRLVELK